MCIEKNKSVQRTAIMITEVSTLPYHLRLGKCGFLFLQDIKKRVDMIDVFKIINGFTDGDTKIILELNHITHSGK